MDGVSLSKESCRFVEQEKSLNQKKAPARYLYYSSQLKNASAPSLDRGFPSLDRALRRCLARNGLTLRCPTCLLLAAPARVG